MKKKPTNGEDFKILYSYTFVLAFKRKGTLKKTSKQNIFYSKLSIRKEELNIVKSRQGFLTFSALPLPSGHSPALKSPPCYCLPVLL
jgi:hypothetical protein